MPNLWFSAPQIQSICRRLANGDPHISGLRDFAGRYADRPLAEVKQAEPDEHGQNVIEDGGIYLPACGVLYLLTGEQSYADKAYEGLSFIIDGWTGSDLGLSGMAMLSSQLLACCDAAWTQPQKLRIRRDLARMVHTFRTTREGNPHQVGNNWWAVTHSGAMIAAMSIHSEPADADGHTFDMAEAIRWSRGRLLAFCKHFGDRGLYHEGLGYQMYTCSNLLAAALASRNFDGVDFLDRYPAMRQMAASLFAAACNRRAFSDVPGEEGSWGAKLSWNDDGPGFGNVSCVPLMIHFAPAQQQPGLRGLYDQLHGHAGPEPSYSHRHNGLLLSLVCYPYDAKPTDPNGVLPTALCDSRQGLAIYRNRYRDGDDAILGCYARTTHVGGHKHEDTGSIRFMALGHDWIIGGGQARGNAAWQSVVLPADGPPDNRKQLSTILWDEVTPAGPVWGTDLRRVSGAYHERYIAARWDDACPALAMLDQLDDHLGRQWDWHLSFAPYLACQIDDDLAGFTLTAPDGTRARVAFLGRSRPSAIVLEHMPDSSRSYSSGATTTYKGRPYIRARFGPGRPLGLYAVMAVSKSGTPTIESGNTLDVTINGKLWKRPFDAAIPADFQPGISAGLSKHPSGDTDYQPPTPEQIADDPKWWTA